MANDVLIIDDDKGITDLLTMLLKNHGFNTTAANTAADGLEYMKENTPDLIILDMIMPNMNGWETCKAIRAVSNVPILILSPLDDLTCGEASDGRLLPLGYGFELGQKHGE